MFEIGREEIQQKVEELLVQGYIVPSTSPFKSPILMLDKKDSSNNGYRLPLIKYVPNTKNIQPNR